MPQKKSRPIYKSERKRRNARLAAVQALYQIEVSGGEPRAVAAEFLQHRLEEEIDGLSLAKIDRELFRELVEGTAKERPELDDMIAAALGPGRAMERLETLLAIILRAGTYELANRPTVAAKNLIVEYVEIATGFFTKREPAMVNAVLDRLAGVLRSEELDRPDAIAKIAEL